MDTLNTEQIHNTKESNKNKSFKTLCVSLFVVVFSFILQILANHLISNHIEVSEFGDYTAIVNGLGLFASITLLGSDTALMNFMSEYFALENWGKAKGYLVFFLNIFTQLIVTILLISSIALWLNHYDKELFFEQFISSHIAIKYLWLSPVLLFAYFFSKLLRVFKYQILSQVLINLVLRAFQLAILYLLLLFSIRLTVGNTVITFVASYMMTLFFILAALKYVFPNSILSARTDVSDKSLWLRVAHEVFIANFFFTRINTIIIIMDKIFDPNPNNAGYLSVLALLVGFLWLPASVIQIMYGAELRPHVKLKRYQELQKITNVSFLFLFSLLVVFIGFFFIFHHEILGYFGHEYTHLYYPATILLAANVVAILVTPAMNIMIYGGKQHLLSLATIYSLCGFVPLSALLVYNWGLNGAIIFIAVTLLTCTILPTWYVKKHMNILPFRFRPLPPPTA